ncbi:hypothetical protein [Streptomyces sp. SM11]|uniref:hypothetical protein n=1 Tax=Streptomyces sp. SM11 TaxID=565557 RepID=UPI002156002C|nr:hypothetical protein [Streptomyces sp. SM11]
MRAAAGGRREHIAASGAENRVLSGLLTRLVHVSLVLLAYSVWRENAPDTLTESWPWKLRRLDVQSATTAAVGSRRPARLGPPRG